MFGSDANWNRSYLLYQVQGQCSFLPGVDWGPHTSFCWSALCRHWLHWPAGCETCPHSQTDKYLVWGPWCCCEKSCDLNLIENLCATVKRRMWDTRYNKAEEQRAAIRATWASTMPQKWHSHQSVLSSMQSLNQVLRHIQYFLVWLSYILF